MCDSGRNRGQLPSFCKQFNFVSISTASCNGQSASAALETKTILFVSHSLSLQWDLSVLLRWYSLCLVIASFL